MRKDKNSLDNVSGNDTKKTVRFDRGRDEEKHLLFLLGGVEESSSPFGKGKGIEKKSNLEDIVQKFIGTNSTRGSIGNSTHGGRRRVEGERIKVLKEVRALEIILEPVLTTGIHEA